MIVLLLLFVTLTSCTKTVDKIWYVETGTVDIPLPEPYSFKPVEFKVKDGLICMDSENYFNLGENLLQIEKNTFLMYKSKK